MTAHPTSAAYLALMAALNSAYDRRAAARIHREDSRKDVERHEQTWAAKQDALERAIAAETAPAIDIEESPRLAQARRDAEAQAAAAERALQAARSRYEELCRVADAAECSVEAAAREVVLTKADLLADEINTVEQEQLQRREQLLGLAGTPFDTRGGPIQLTDKMLGALRNPQVPLGQPKYSPALSIEQGPHIARIAEHSREWHARLAALIAGQNNVHKTVRADAATA